MNRFQFRSEAHGSIPLPPKYTFPQALNYLNPIGNGFYILENTDGSYVQCAGSKKRLTIEVKNSRGHFRMGRIGASESAETIIECSAGPISVRGNEVLQIEDAIAVLNAFYSSDAFPMTYSLRQLSVDLR